MATKDLGVDIESAESFSEELVSFMMERPSLAGEGSSSPLLLSFSAAVPFTFPSLPFTGSAGRLLDVGGPLPSLL